MKVESQNEAEKPVTVEVRELANHRQQGNPARRWWIAVLAFVVVVAIVVSGILPRINARAALDKETAEMAIPTVSVVQPKRGAPAQEVVLPANVQAYIDAPIYARTNGYLKHWYADIGAHVKAGQLLADIETPEVDQQLRQARADLATAEANLNLSQITANRYADLLKTDSVSKQETDNAAGDYAAKQATVQSAQANVRRLEELQAFEKIYAPFDGVITARNTDIGALIDSGAAVGQGQNSFILRSRTGCGSTSTCRRPTRRRRSPGLTADLVLSEFPGPAFPGNAGPHGRCYRPVHANPAGRNSGEQSDRYAAQRSLC